MTAITFPAYWWGHNNPRQVAPEYSIVELLQGKVMNSEVAALLWALLHRRASCITVGGHYSGAGKSTTLTALSSFQPADTERIFTRGRLEDFAWLKAAVPDRTCIMVGEFSNHTPAYLWGPGAAQVFRLRERGYTFLGTMHADNVEELLAELMAPPVSLAPGEVAAGLQLLVLQAMIPELNGRRVTSVSWIYPTERGPRGIGAKGLAAWDPTHDLWYRFTSPDTWAQLAAWCGVADAATFQREVDDRQDYLEALLAEGITGFDDVHHRLAAFHR